MRCPSPYEEYVARDFLFRDLYSESPWFFPPMRINGVEIKGFFGTGKIIFVAKRPSTGKFPDPRVRYFYELLRKHNFANAHLTDLIKCRGLAKKKEEINDQFENCKEFLQEEIDILTPCMIVGVGKEAQDRLKKMKQQNEIKQHVHLYPIHITHYGFRYTKKEELKRQLAKEFRDLAQEYRTFF